MGSAGNQHYHNNFAIDGYGESANSFGQPHPQQEVPFTDGTADEQAAPMTSEPSFDVLDWHPTYQSCQRYFLDHSQHEPGTQALCALVNIRLPFQWLEHPISSSSMPQPPPQQAQAQASAYNLNAWPRQGVQSPPRNSANLSVFVSLIPYIRRLIITGFDKPGILHGFFGDDYVRGVCPLQECERRNYLFAAKHGGWRSCKKQYDMNSEESVPFLKPLDRCVVEELEAAEKSWSNWLAMEDWMVGPRAPADDSVPSSQRQGGADAEGQMPGGMG